MVNPGNEIFQSQSGQPANHRHYQLEGPEKKAILRASPELKYFITAPAAIETANVSSESPMEIKKIVNKSIEKIKLDADVRRNSGIMLNDNSFVVANLGWLF